MEQVHWVWDRELVVGWACAPQDHLRQVAFPTKVMRRRRVIPPILCRGGVLGRGLAGAGFLVGEEVSGAVVVVVDADAVGADGGGRR